MAYAFNDDKTKFAINQRVSDILSFNSGSETETEFFNRLFAEVKNKKLYETYGKNLKLVVTSSEGEIVLALVKVYYDSYYEALYACDFECTYGLSNTSISVSEGKAFVHLTQTMSRGQSVGLKYNYNPNSNGTGTVSSTELTCKNMLETAFFSAGSFWFEA